MSAARPDQEMLFDERIEEVPPRPSFVALRAQVAHHAAELLGLLADPPPALAAPERFGTAWQAALSLVLATQWVHRAETCAQVGQVHGLCLRYAARFGAQAETHLRSLRPDLAGLLARMRATFTAPPFAQE